MQARKRPGNRDAAKASTATGDGALHILAAWIQHSVCGRSTSKGELQILLVVLLGCILRPHRSDTRFDELHQDKLKDRSNFNVILWCSYLVTICSCDLCACWRSVLPL